jgi:hypothetical protein
VLCPFGPNEPVHWGTGVAFFNGSNRRHSRGTEAFLLSVDLRTIRSHRRCLIFEHRMSSGLDMPPGATTTPQYSIQGLSSRRLSAFLLWYGPDNGQSFITTPATTTSAFSPSGARLFACGASCFTRPRPFRLRPNGQGFAPNVGAT